MAIAVPYDEGDVTDVTYEQPPTEYQPEFTGQEPSAFAAGAGAGAAAGAGFGFGGGEATGAAAGVPQAPTVPSEPVPQPNVARVQSTDLTEPQRQEAIKRSRAQLEEATKEVEKFKPTLSKFLDVIGGGLKTGLVSGTRQAFGNVMRDYLGIVAPETPHAPGSFKSILQWAVAPDISLLAEATGTNDPSSIWAQLRDTAQLTAEQGSKELKAEAQRAEDIGGGPSVSAAASLASTAGASLPPLLAGPWGLGAMAAASGLQAYGQNVDQFTERVKELNPELTDQQARDKAMVPAAITAAVTAVLTRGFGGTERFIEQLAHKGLSAGGVKGALREVFKSAALELPEEYLDQLSQGFNEKLFIDPEKPVSDIFNEAGLAGLAGFTLGGVTTGSILGVGHGGKALASRLRRGETINAKNQNGPPGALSAGTGQPINTGPEGEAQVGVAQRPREGGGGQAAITPAPLTPLTTTQISEQAVARTLPPPLPAAPPEKIATFSGYQFDNPNLPQYEIPGVRPGIVRHVSAQTAQQYGYTVPERIPTFEEWKRGPIPQAAQTTESLSPANPEKYWSYNELSPRITEKSAQERGTYPRFTVKVDGEQIEVNTPKALDKILQSTRAKSPAVYTNRGGGVTIDFDAAENLSPSNLKRIPIEIEKADGTRVKGEFTGYYDMRDYNGTTPMSVGKLNENGQMSHGFLGANEKIIGNVPSFEEWNSGTQEAAHPPTTPQEIAAAPIDHTQFTRVNEAGYRVIDSEKLRDLIKQGKLRGGDATDALLLHMLGRSDLHPLNDIHLIDTVTPEQLKELNKAGYSLTSARPTQGGAYQGRFSTEAGSNVGTIEVLTRDDSGRPLSTAEFLGLLLHELSHNNLGSKLADAPPALQEAVHKLYMFAVEKAQGTEWESHNATSNPSEFLSEMTSIPGFQKWLTQLDYSGRATAKGPSLLQSVYGKALDLLRRIFKLPEWITTPSGKKVNVVTALDEALNLSSQLEEVQRRTPAQRAEAFSLAAAPNLPEAQVQAGAAEVGRIADEIYKTREQSVSALSQLSYERQQYRTARQEMRRLTEQGVAGFTKLGMDPESIKFPDPTEGVGVNENGEISADNTFSEKLNLAGVPHNPDNVRSMQEQIVYEQSASRYNSLGQRIDTLKKASEYYTQLGAPAEEVAKINKELGTLESKQNALGNVTLDGALVSERATEITDAEASRQERMAQRDALSLEPVTDFFGKQVGAYRDFASKAQAGIAWANQLKQNVNDPVALKAAMDEAAKWMTIPADVRNSILGGKALTPEQKASAFSALSQVFEDFDYSYTRMKEQLEARVPEINARIRDTLEKISKAKIDSGMGQVLLSDVASALDGETGLSGNLKSLQENQALRERLSAIQKFAETLGDNLQDKNKQGSQALFDWIVDPSNPPPAVAENLGVDSQTLEMILRAIKRSPDFNSAILALVEATNSKIANLPATGIQQIEELVKQGTPEAQTQAEAIAQDMLKKGKSQTSLANASLRESLKELDALEIERASLQQGRAMFDELVASPEFGATREAVSNSPYGLVEPMIPQNNRQTTFKAFGSPTLPSHPELVIGVGQDPQFKSQWYQKVAEWRKKAAEHLDAYDKAATEYNQTKDSENPSPSPQQLGFDIPKVRGLRDALQRMIDGSFLEMSLNSENKRWGIPWLARKLSKLDWFRQHDFVAKMVGGMTGTDLRARLADFVNHFLTAQSIRDQYKDLPEKLHAALRSHNTAATGNMGMNIQNYREHFNELAHWGRMFGSPVREGFILPRSQRKVTKEDMALLSRERAYEEDLRRRVTETNPTQGVRINTPTRTLVRPGAYVGDQGVPRFLNRRADSFINNILAAYGQLHADYLQGPNSPLTPVEKEKIRLSGTTQPPGSFDPTTNLGPSSSSPIVQFWNGQMPMLIQHILDVRRQDRAMRLTPHMQAAENDLMLDWMTPGGPAKPTNLEELVQALTAKFPAANVTGLNPRDQVIKGLNAELRQYRDAAKGIENDRVERDQARQSKARIAFSADNEFTKPAAKLELPSQLYDYGALSPGDHMAISSRANHERIVGYATAIERAISELQSRYDAYQRGEITEKQAAESYGGNITEMRDTIGLLRSIAKDFESAYNSGSFTQAKRGFLNDTIGFLTSAILGLPTVGLRNMTQGQMEVYAMNRAMGVAGHVMTGIRALKAIPHTLTRFGVHALDGIVNNTQLGKAIGPANHKVLVDMVGKIGNMLTGEDFRDVAARVGSLGMDNRDSFMKRLGRIMQETQEFISREDEEKAWTLGGRKVGATATIPFKVIRAFYDKIGVQQYDFAINTAALSNTDLIAQRLKQVAINYGKAREREGLTKFDPTNRAFDLRPDEWSTGQSASSTLAFMRQLLESSVSAEGFQLERSMWDWYQAQKENPKTPFFNERQTEALQKRILADFNASTPTNRPSAVPGSNVLRNILLLQGYPSDLLLKLLNTGFGSARDKAGAAKAIMIAPHLAGMALMAVLIGYITSAITGGWEKWIRGRQPSLATTLDWDFWNNWKRLGSGTLALGAAQLGYIGDLILGIRGEILQNRGFDPNGRILSLSLLSRGLNALRGSYNTIRGAGNVSDALTPWADLGRSLLPPWLEVEHLIGQTMRARKQAERVFRGEAGVQGLLEGKSGFTPPAYGPTTVVRRNLGDAIDDYYQAKQAGDEATAARKLEDAKAEAKKLYDYHYGRYVAAGKDPTTAAQMAQRDVWNDYNELNPAVAAMLGKRPTQDQFNLMMEGITGDRRAVVDQGLASWSAGAQALFGRPGVTTREQVAAGRGGGFGGGFNIPGLKTPSFPSATAGLTGARQPAAERQPSVMRQPTIGGGGGGGGVGRGAGAPPAVRAQSQSRLRRAAQAPLAAVRRGVRAVRQSALLRPARRQAGPVIRRSGGVIPRPRQRSLVRRPRPAYAPAY